MSANTGERQRTKWLQIRVSKDELENVKRLADVYGLDVSDFIRYAIRWIDDERPEMSIAPRKAAE
jgi:predicted DNA binding CopG/RHH family protein